MRNYVVGYLFSEDRKQVAMIRKTHPEWQAGKLNGPGGKVELGEGGLGGRGETPRHAMQREFAEECGYLI